MQFMSRSTCRNPESSDWETTGHFFFLFLSSLLGKSEPGPHNSNIKITLHWRKILLFLLFHVTQCFQRSIPTGQLPMKDSFCKKHTFMYVFLISWANVRSIQVPKLLHWGLILFNSEKNVLIYNCCKVNCHIHAIKVG